MAEETFVKFSKDRIVTRQVNELIGISKGLVADGIVTQSEAEFLQTWLATNFDIMKHPVIGKLLSRVDLMLEDGVLDNDEAADLLHLLTAISGISDGAGEVSKSISTPFNDPLPKLEFAERNFCMTGIFSAGTRKECEKTTIELGGIKSGINRKLDFLIIGEYAADAWKYGSFGTKIEKAMQIRDDGFPLTIIGEKHWAEVIA